MASWLRRCPKCGKRFGVSLLSRETVNREKGSETITQDVMMVSGGSGKGGQTFIPTTRVVETERDTVVSTFKCSKCGKATAR